jgi:16S rRNA (guanine527-N7)-methyltransferase
MKILTEEQIKRLKIYEAELLRWNNHINLIGKSTQNAIWERHFKEGIALTTVLPQDKTGRIADFGSGSGIPGLVLAILTEHPIYLIEADQKKAAFLHHVASLCSCNVTVLTQRIETISPLSIDVAVARACAPLDVLFGFCERHLQAKGEFHFLKGKNVMTEIEAAQNTWTFTYKIHTINLGVDKATLVSGQHLQRS